jgi:hypothetical protein
LKIPKVEVLTGITAACFMLLIIIAILDGLTSSELIPLVIQVVGIFLAIGTLVLESGVRKAELQIKEDEAYRAKDEYQRKLEVLKARGRVFY